MRERARRIAERSQRNPAGGKLLLGAKILLVRQRGLARHTVGLLGIAKVEKLAGDRAAFHPPLIGIDRGTDRRIDPRIEPLAVVLRHAQNHVGRLGCLLRATQQLHAAEDASDVALGLRREGVEQRLAVRGFFDDGDARLGDCRRIAAGTVRGAQAAIHVFGVKAAASSRALWSAAVIRSLKMSRAGPSRSLPNASLRQASRISACAADLSPCSRSARASANLPLAVVGLSLPKKERTAIGSGRSDHSAASARRRNRAMAGQLGFSERNAV